MYKYVIINLKINYFNTYMSGFEIKVNNEVVGQIKKMKLVELLDLSTRADYKLPDKDFSEWGRDDVFEYSTCKVLSDEVLIKASLLLCDMVPPVKMLFKGRLRDYIKKFGLRTDET